MITFEHRTRVVNSRRTRVGRLLAMGLALLTVLGVGPLARAQSAGPSKDELARQLARQEAARAAKIDLRDHVQKDLDLANQDLRAAEEHLKKMIDDWKAAPSTEPWERSLKDKARQEAVNAGRERDGLKLKADQKQRERDAVAEQVTRLDTEIQKIREKLDGISRRDAETNEWAVRIETGADPGVTRIALFSSELKATDFHAWLVAKPAFFTVVRPPNHPWDGTGSSLRTETWEVAYMVKAAGTLPRRFATKDDADAYGKAVQARYGFLTRSVQVAKRTSATP